MHTRLTGINSLATVTMTSASIAAIAPMLRDESRNCAQLMSICSRSAAKRETMRPEGVLSKKDRGALSKVASIVWCRFADDRAARERSK